MRGGIAETPGIASPAPNRGTEPAPNHKEARMKDTWGTRLFVALAFAAAVFLVMGLVLDTRSEPPWMGQAQRVGLVALTLRRAEASLDRAKELREQSMILLQKAEGELWAARLSEATRNVCVSWYGKPYHGRLAASGVRFDMNDRHVAHRWLPFGAKVVFYNPLNGEVSHGTVVDRGPFIDGRAFDVSFFMAQELGIIEPGIAIVRCWVTELPGELLRGRPSMED